MRKSEKEKVPTLSVFLLVNSKEAIERKVGKERNVLIKLKLHFITVLIMIIYIPFSSSSSMYRE